MKKSTVTLQACPEYQINSIREAVNACLNRLGGMKRFVQPGMKVLLKPNLLSAHQPEKAVTTHPFVVQAVAETVLEAGGVVWIGDSPNTSIQEDQMEHLWQTTGMNETAQRVGARLIPFKGVSWRRMHDYDYFIARPVGEANLVINLPKLKTHSQTLYTGAVKNLFGVIPGARKTAAHVHAPGINHFSQLLADVLQIVHPGLTILDAVVGLEGNGPGAGGTPFPYHCIAASTDPVALDAVFSRAIGFRPGEVFHLAVAGERNLGTCDPDQIQVDGDANLLRFGPVRLPSSHWFYHVPSWVSAPLANHIKLQPEVAADRCTSCGTCTTVCPVKVITNGKPPLFRLSECIGCMCCAESCPEGAIHPKRSILAKLVGFNG
jgi:uncharacterized protein (DUF362 family)/Pyruvate/2-oxoacid:ferredoxin oxidoreductase delta subunit